MVEAKGDEAGLATCDRKGPTAHRGGSAVSAELGGPEQSKRGAQGDYGVMAKLSVLLDCTLWLCRGDTQVRGAFGLKMADGGENSKLALGEGRLRQRAGLAGS